jgi:hypothetical protein
VSRSSSNAVCASGSGVRSGRFALCGLLGQFGGAAGESVASRPGLQILIAVTETAHSKPGVARPLAFASPALQRPHADLEKVGGFLFGPYHHGLSPLLGCPSLGDRGNLRVTLSGPHDRQRQIATDPILSEVSAASSAAPTALWCDRLELDRLERPGTTTSCDRKVPSWWGNLPPGRNEASLG